MRVNSKLPKLQEGGMMPPQEGPAMAGGDQMPMGGEEQMGAEQDPLMQIAQVAAQALQTGDCEAMAAVCEAFLQLIQQVGQEQAPEAPQEPTFQKKGGKISRRG